MKERPAPYVRTIFVCCNDGEPGKPACGQRGSNAIREQLKDYTKAKGVSKKCRVSRAMCFGLCQEGPNVCVMPDNVWLNGVSAGDVPAIIETYIKPLEQP